MEQFPSALPMVLLQWTLLLALGWGLHTLLGRGHPRWRLILWRSILCFTLLIPLAGMLRVPRIELPAPKFVSSEIPLHRSVNPNPAADGESAAGAPVLRELRPMEAPTAMANAKISEQRLPAIRWGTTLLTIWLIGTVWGLFRLFMAHVELRRLVDQAGPASKTVELSAEHVRCELGVRRRVRVRVSREIDAPFLCGVRRPVILVPNSMDRDLPPSELAALLTHEMAHEFRSDVAWCLAWQLMRALTWFHPLVWAVPAAHVMACEEEADRIAANRRYGEHEYQQVLALLALRVLGSSAAEIPLALNATSHIARRLLKLASASAIRWRGVHSFAAFAMAGGLFVVSAGWHFAQETVRPPSPTDIASATVIVAVQDENGRAVEGAVIQPVSLRAQGGQSRGASYGWVLERHGPAVKAVTDREGRAKVTYPVSVLPSEKLLTGEISFTVDHPDYAKIWTANFPVAGTAMPVQLKRGTPVRVTAYFGAAKQRVQEIVPRLIGDRVIGPNEWQRDVAGSYVFRRLSPKRHFLYVAGRLPTGEVGYTEGLAFFGEQRDEHDLALELKPGIRVKGQIDRKAPRPIKNGWVQLSVHNEDASVLDTRRIPVPRSFGNTGIWWSYRPIAPDGTFVFESVPPGEINVIAYGEGFVSTNGPREEPPLPPGVQGQLPRRITRAVPQTFLATSPISIIEIVTEPTAILTVRATSGGKTVAGAHIYVFPNMIRMPNGSRLFGAGEVSSEAPFKKLPPVPVPIFSATTNAQGIAVLRDIPAFSNSLGVMHTEFEVPLREVNAPGAPSGFQPAPNRYVELNLTPGETANVEIVLQPRGREFSGMHR